MDSVPPLPPGPPPFPQAVSTSPAWRPWALRGAVLAFSGLLYLISLFLPAMYVEGQDPWPGAQLAFVGAFGVFLGQMAWLAHVPWFIALITLMCGLRKTTALMVLFALFIAFNSFTVPGTVIPLDEANVRKAEVIGFGPALWVWLASLATPFVAIFLPAKRPKVI